MIWGLIATSKYIDQVSKFGIQVGDNISRPWIEVCKNEDISFLKQRKCPLGKKYYKTVFRGLEYQFIFEINDEEKFIRLINCRKLDFLNYGQVD
ncbi:MAG: hypothetical protein AB7V56_07225 [Candidatus Nitrosocosmicus sp.]